jgi:hypothetical protein
MAKIFKQGLWVVAAVLLLSGCDLLPSVIGDKPTPVPPAVEMLPELDGYTVIEGQTLTGYLSNLSGGAALLTGQPQLAALAKAVDGVISCYQQVGAARARIYSQTDNPLSAGVVAIADRGALMDPQNFFKCVVPNTGIGKNAPTELTIQPCSANYTLTKDGNEFYILYAGTTLEICQTFCARLENCTAHK